MDGLSLARHIYEERLPVQLVFLSAYSDFEYARKGLEYGVKDFIVKPLRYQNLEETFRNLRQSCSVFQSFSSARDSLPAEDMHKSIAQQAEHYISVHLTDATLESAALALGISSQTLSRTYKRETGKTFADALLDARMERAKEMICGFNIRLFSIAEALGYSNSKNFTRAFHHYYGMTPSEYRKTHTASD